jgi:hypothetical protein
MSHLSVYSENNVDKRNILYYNVVGVIIH